jgi:hypothetical protein
LIRRDSWKTSLSTSMMPLLDFATGCCICISSVRVVRVRKGS